MCPTGVSARLGYTLITKSTGCSVCNAAHVAVVEPFLRDPLFMEMFPACHNSAATLGGGGELPQGECGRVTASGFIYLLLLNDSGILSSR